MAVENVRVVTGAVNATKIIVLLSPANATIVAGVTSGNARKVRVVTSGNAEKVYFVSGAPP